MLNQHDSVKFIFTYKFHNKTDLEQITTIFPHIFYTLILIRNQTTLNRSSEVFIEN